MSYFTGGVRGISLEIVKQYIKQQKKQTNVHFANVAYIHHLKEVVLRYDLIITFIGTREEEIQELKILLQKK